MSEKTDKIKAASGQQHQERNSSAERLRDFLARSFYGILVVDHHGIIRFANQSAATIFGCGIEQLPGERPGFPLVTNETTELAVKSRDGRTVVLEMRGMATEWDGKPATVVHLQDITGRRQKEQELRKLYRAVLEIPSIVMITDANGIIEFVNPRFTEVTGYTFAEAVGRNPRFLKSGKTPPGIYKELWETIQAGREWRGEMINRKKNGELYWESAAISPVKDMEGKITNFITVTEDITERKRMEEALRESEVKFSKAFQAVPALLSISSLANGEYIEVNEAFEKTLGYRRDEVIGRPAPRLGIWENPNDRDRLIRLLREGKRIRDFETRLRGKTGGVIVGALSAEIINIKGEECLLALTRDITRIKQAEEKLRKNEQQLSEAQRLARLGSWEWNIGADKLTASAELSRIFGVPPEELDPTYAGILKMVHPDDRENYERVIRAAISEKSSYDNYHRIIRPDGTVRILHSQGTVTVDETGTPVSLIGTCQDVTERRQAEVAQRESEHRFRTLAAASYEGIAVTEQGRILDVNEQLTQILGYERSELIGVKVADLLPPEEHDRVLTNILLGKESHMEHEMLCRDGSRRIVEARGKTIDQHGRRLRITAIRDVTERRITEERIELLNTDLMARAVELEAANRELEAFSYTVSHDLRKPLTVINGYSQMILDMCGSHLDEQCTRFLREVSDGTLRMNQLIDSLLDFSRLTRCELRRETVDLCGMARALAAEFSLAEPGRRVAFRFGDGIMVNADAGLLRVVLTNLLGNAWKYTAVREEAVIEIGVTEVAGEPACFVRDNGPGFDMAHADKLFVPFQRLPGADEFQGHGIGLATAHRIIQRHGGRMWAEAAPGKGATFYFTLPADKPGPSS